MKKTVLLLLMFFCCWILRFVIIGNHDVLTGPITFVTATLGIIKSHFVSRSESLIPKPHSTLLVGMLLGDSDLKMPAKFKEDLRRTGVIHVIVVSGYNMTIIASFCSNLFRLWFGSSRRALVFIFSLAALLLYAIMVGGGAAVVRSAIMASIVLLRKFYGRQSNSIRPLLIASIMMLMVKPDWIFDIGFQLSVLATLGIIMFSEAFKAVIDTSLRRIRNLSYFINLNENLATSLSAIIMVWPIISFHFGQISIISPVANVVLLWLVPYIMLLGSIMLTIDIFSSKIAELISIPLYYLLDYFVNLVSYISTVSYSNVSLRIGAIFIIFYFLLLFYIRKVYVKGS